MKADSTPDPNADLIGRTVTVEGINCTVTGTAPWSVQYVLLSDGEEYKSCVLAKLLRR